MARDNSPKVRQREQLERKQGQRASYDRILIVSEGSKTEPNYLNEIRVAHRLRGDRFKGIRPRAFDQTYAVFDRDEHQSYLNSPTAKRLATL